MPREEKISFSAEDFFRFIASSRAAADDGVEPGSFEWIISIDSAFFDDSRRIWLLSSPGFESLANFTASFESLARFELRFKEEEDERDDADDDDDEDDDDEDDEDEEDEDEDDESLKHNC